MIAVTSAFPLVDRREDVRDDGVKVIYFAGLGLVDSVVDDGSQSRRRHLAGLMPFGDGVDLLQPRQFIGADVGGAGQRISSASRPLEEQVVHQGEGVPQRADDELRGVLAAERGRDVGVLLVIQLGNADQAD